MDTVQPIDPVEWPAPYRLRDCPSRTIVDTLASTWAKLILGALGRADRPLRFNELRRLLDGVTQKMLTRTLRLLERDGMVKRTVYPTVPPRVEYGLTELGVGAGALADAIAEWSMAHAREILAARVAFDERAAREPEPLPDR